MNLPFDPTSIGTVLSLLAAIALLIYLYLKQKNKNELKQVKDLNEADRPKYLEQKLNDFGTQIDPSDLTPAQKYDLLKTLMNNKLKKWVFGTVALVALAAISFFAIKNDNQEKTEKQETPIETPAEVEAQNTFSISTGNKAVDDSLKARLVGDGFVLENASPTYRIQLKSSGENEKASHKNRKKPFKYYYGEKEVQLVINGGEPISTGVKVSETKPNPPAKDNRPEARAVHMDLYYRTLNQNIDNLYQFIYDNLKK